MTIGFGTGSPLTLSIAMIWLAHIGIDRALGYGLKYNAGFHCTHLGPDRANLGATQIARLFSSSLVTQPTCRASLAVERTGCARQKP